MFRPVVFVDDVLSDIERDVAGHRPERGGALLGPVGLPVISRFIHDPQAATSGVTYQPSRALQHAVTQAERADRNMELKGMLHSHPGEMDHPSSGDRVAIADSLDGAPWLGRFVSPIVTGGPGRGRGTAHEIALPSGTMSVYVAEFGSDKRLDLQPAQATILPIVRDTSQVAAALSATLLGRGLVEVDSLLYLSAGIRLDGLDLQLLFPWSYPTTAPIMLAVPDDTATAVHPLLAGLGIGQPPGGAVALPVVWDLAVPEQDRLLRSLLPAAPDPARDPETARIGIRSRLDGVVSSGLTERRVLIVGAGSGGSQTADALARSGVENFTLIDPDLVVAANLSRSVYRLPDVGEAKVVALARHLQAINPLIDCQLHQDRLQDLTVQTIDQLVGQADLVVAATDDLKVQRTVNHFSYARGVPAVFGGVYARGHAGEVIFTVPGITRCYRCTTTSRHQEPGQARTADYGTGRLDAEPALGVDIQHVVSTSVKIAIGLLELAEDSSTSSARELVFQALDSGYRNYLILSTVGNYGFFRDIFAQTPAQHAYQAVWMSVVGDPDCAVCGPNPVDPLTTPVRAARTDRISPLAEARPEPGDAPATEAGSQPTEPASAVAGD